METVEEVAQAKGSLGPGAQAGEDHSWCRDCGRAGTLVPAQGPAPARWMFIRAAVNCTSPGRVRAGSHGRMEHGGDEGAQRREGVTPGESSKSGLCLPGSQEACPWCIWGVPEREAFWKQWEKKEHFLRTPTLLYVICSTLQSVCCFFWSRKLFREFDLNFCITLDA